jgi:hypothetical protein
VYGRKIERLEIKICSYMKISCREVERRRYDERKDAERHGKDSVISDEWICGQ